MLRAIMVGGKSVYGAAGVLFVGAVLAASAASLYTEDFDPNNNGWVGRDSVATVNNNGGFGNPAASAQMNFALQGSPTPRL